MSHSVSGHLALQVADYDKLIRRLVPAYDKMREVQLAALEFSLGGALAQPALVLDLGGGTGALADAIAERFSDVRVEIWDTDPAMLEIAAGRCARWGGRVRGIARSFTDPLPSCDAVAAAIALHHVKDLKVKAGIYRNIYAALRPGGIFVNADTAVASNGPVQEFAYRKWIDDMGRHSITAPEARAHLASWANEDYYPPVFTELQLLKEAGFAEPEVFWREGAAIVFGGLR